MSKWPGPVFEAVEAEGRRRKDESVYKAAAICHLARRHVNEIDALRLYRHQMREIATREPKRNGTIAMLDMHPVELEAISYLCPEFRAPNAQQQRQGLRWVEKQPWAAEFLPPQYEKVRY